MEKDLKFSSAVCTSRVQSERLLALGLKKETADMRWERISEKYAYYPSTKTPYVSSEIPSWSLHRLIEMINEEIQTDWQSMCLQDQCFTIRDNLYDNIVDCIEWLIKEGYFNKEYLEE